MKYRGIKIFINSQEDYYNVERVLNEHGIYHVNDVDGDVEVVTLRFDGKRLFYTYSDSRHLWIGDLKEVEIGWFDTFYELICEFGFEI